MNELRVTFYDASYHASAIDQKGKFITSDKKYFERVKGKAYIQCSASPDFVVFLAYQNGKMHVGMSSSGYNFNTLSKLSSPLIEQKSKKNH